MTDGNFNVDGDQIISRNNSTANYVSKCFNNKENATLNVSSGNFNSSINGFLLENLGSATISNITSTLQGLVYNNTGVLNLNNVSANNLSYGFESASFAYAYPVFSQGTLNIDGGTYNCSTINECFNTSNSLNIKNATINSIKTAVVSGKYQLYGSDYATFTNNNITSTEEYAIQALKNTKIESGTYTGYKAAVSTYRLNNVNYTNNSTPNLIIETGIFNSSNGSAIENTTTGITTLGIKDGIVDLDSLTLKGQTYGLSSIGNINIYDGTIIGITSSISGSISELEDEHKLTTETIDEDGISKIKSYLTRMGESEKVAVVNKINFTDLQSAVNYSANNGYADIVLYSDITLSADLINPGEENIKIYLNDHIITLGEYTISDTITLEEGVDQSLLGSIYKFLANILNIEVNPRNIVIYMMSDGSKLTDEETYKLYKEDKLVTFNNIETGKYKLGNNVEEIGTVNNRIYIEGLGEGSYKLVSSTNKEVTFEITKDKVLGNVREYTIENENRKTSEAVAEYIIQIQTGINRVNYLLIIISILVSVLSLIIINKKKSIKI